MVERPGRGGPWVTVVILAVVVGALGLNQMMTSRRNIPSQSPPQTAARRTSYLPVAGSLAPDFTLPDLDGTPVTLSQYRGQVVLLNLWALWCRPCIDEMPSMQKLYDSMQGEEFVLLAVEVGRSKPPEVREFVAAHDLAFPVLLDTESQMKGLYAITGVPETFLLARDGRVERKVIGSRDWGSNRALADIQRLLDDQG